MQTALDWIKHNTTLLPGYSIDLMARDTKCQPNEAAKVFTKSLVSRDGTPDIVVGFGCSGAARAVLPVAVGVPIPVVGAATNAGSLSNQKLFVRYMFSYDVAGQLAGAIAHSLSLHAVGAVASQLFQSVQNHLANARRNITSCGFVLYEDSTAQLLGGKMDKLHSGGCR